jgi:hypothetical protein
MTEYNYITLARMRHLAEQHGQVITTKPKPLLPGFPDGVDVYRHRAGTEPTADDWVAWMADPREPEPVASSVIELGRWKSTQ